MAHTNSTEDSLVEKYIGAIGYLEDITTIHTDPNLASLRAKLVRGGLSFDLVRAHEVFGIAKAVADRFYSTPQHAYATKAVSSACYISVTARQWFQDGHGDDGPGYRTLLLKYLDWVHKTGDTIHDITCLCPVTAYLQLIIRNTPMEDWAVAATDPPDASPLAFAWAWARTSPHIGSQTADIVALVTMGCNVRRAMLDAQMRADQLRHEAAHKTSERFLYEGFWAGCREVASNCLVGAAKWLQGPPSEFDKYKRKLEEDHAKELWEIAQIATESLREAGQGYAQLLEDKDVAQERVDSVVESIRSRAAFILGKAEPPVPEKVLLAIPGLATAGQESLG